MADTQHPKSNVPELDDRSSCDAPVSNADQPCSGGPRTLAVAAPFRVPWAAAAYTPVAAEQQPAAVVAVRQFAAARTMPGQRSITRQVRREPGFS